MERLIGLANETEDFNQFNMTTSPSNPARHIAGYPQGFDFNALPERPRTAPVFPSPFSSSNPAPAPKSLFSQSLNGRQQQQPNERQKQHQRHRSASDPRRRNDPSTPPVHLPSVHTHGRSHQEGQRAGRGPRRPNTAQPAFKSYDVPSSGFDYFGNTSSSFFDDDFDAGDLAAEEMDDPKAHQRHERNSRKKRVATRVRRLRASSPDKTLPAGYPSSLKPLINFPPTKE